MAQLTVPVSGRDHIRGKADVPLTLLEYGDYECPYCGAAAPTVKRVQKHLGDSLCFVYRHFPLATVHPRSEPAAEAAEAAGTQGRFWQMHDTLFAHQHALDDFALTRYATDIGLDVATFQLELAAHAHAGRVREDFMSGVRSGVNRTPTFFINGRRHDGAYDFASLLLALEWERSMSAP